MIRKARINDKESVSQLYYMSAPYICKYCFASEEQPTLSLISMLYEKPENIMSGDYYWVYEDENLIKGAISAFPGIMNKNYNKNIGRYVKEIYTIAGLSACVKMMIRNFILDKYVPSIYDDELYIESLAVFPEFRGKRISSALMNFVFDYARENNFKKVSLLAETNNDHAIDVYKNFGFKETEVVNLPLKFHKLQIYGFYKFVIDIG